MKKILFGFLLICIAFSSCKKDNKGIIPTVKLQKVTFNLGFTQSTGTFQTNSLRVNSTTPDTSLTNHIKVLYYMVFDSAGNNVHNITQLSTDTSFGHYTDNLHSGKYTVAIAGGNPNLVISPGNLTKQYMYYQVNVPTFDDPLPGPFDQDAYIYRGTFTVVNTALSKNVTLTRAGSKLLVNVNDAIPNNTVQAQLTLNYYVNTYFVGTGSTGLYTLTSEGFSTSTTYTYNIKSTDWGKTNYQLSTLFLYGTKPMSVTITFYGQNTTIAQKEVQNVTGMPDKVTILSGNLFGGAGNPSAGSFQVAIDSAWNTPIIKTFP